MFHVPEKFRYKTGPLASTEKSGNNGFFLIPISHGTMDRKRLMVACQASDGEGWEHVSVSLPGIRSTPPWELMSMIKKIFWDAEDTVIQFHPKESEYVNCHPYCLHLWRKVGSDQELPPSILVGPKEKKESLESRIETFKAVPEEMRQAIIKKFK